MVMAFRIMLLMVVLLPTTAHAYIGPGAGISAIGSLLALLAAIILGIVGFVWYPVKRIMNKRKKAGTQAVERVKETSS
jgi:cellobiose-specific phosphotransferase system component IIC